MIGTVEIYANFGTDKQELLHTESNLLVNGAGEAFCDLLTTPSAVVSAFPYGDGSSLTDSSNFTVQAISFGKSSDAYKNNGHFYPFNLSSYINGKGDFGDYINFVRSDHMIRAVSLDNENISVTTSSYDPKRDPGSTPNVNDIELEKGTNTAIDMVSGQYHLMGSSVMQGRAHDYGHNLNRILSNTNPNLISFTDGPTTDPDLIAGNELYWTSALVGNYGLSSAVLNKRGTGPFYGTSSFTLSGANGFRLGVTASGIWPSHHHGNVDHTFSVYAKLPSDATPFTACSGIILEIRNITRSNNNQVGFQYYSTSSPGSEPGLLHGYYHAPSAVWSLPYVGTGMVGTGIGASGAVGRVTPASGADGSAGWYRFEIDLQGLGHNRNPSQPGDQIHARCRFLGGNYEDPVVEMYGWQFEEGFGASKFKRVKGKAPTVDEGGQGGDIFLGCYPHTSGTDFAILSSISNLDSRSDNIFASGTYPESTNENYFNSSAIRSMDQNGFVRAYNNVLGGLASPTSGLIVSANSDFSSTGEVQYLCTIASADLGLANMYGGIFKLGLWTIDLPRTLSTIGTERDNKIIPDFPLRFSAGYNRIVYKLFAEKSLTKNLAVIKDDGTHPGCRKHSDLTIVWKIKFI